MKSLEFRINERYKQGRTKDEESEIQTYVDIISQNPKAYQKYIDVLKDRYGVDFYEYYKDEHHIENANLKDIKKQDDFLDFENYVKYAYKIFNLRNLNQPKHIDKSYTNTNVSDLGKKLGFSVKSKEYSGRGNYASFDYTNNTITTPKIVDVNTLIHEIGHWFDRTYSKDYVGLAKTITYASSPYSIRLNAEVFAENFMHYFIAPNFLKSKLPEVYKELDKRIPPNIKMTLIELL